MSSEEKRTAQPMAALFASLHYKASLVLAVVIVGAGSGKRIKGRIRQVQTHVLSQCRTNLHNPDVSVRGEPMLHTGSFHDNHDVLIGRATPTMLCQFA